MAVAGAARCAVVGAGSGATADPQAEVGKQPFYVTSGNIGRRDRAVRRVLAVSGDALRGGTTPFPTATPPEGN